MIKFSEGKVKVLLDLGRILLPSNSTHLFTHFWQLMSSSMYQTGTPACREVVQFGLFIFRIYAPNEVVRCQSPNQPSLQTTIYATAQILISKQPEHNQKIAWPHTSPHKCYTSQSQSFIQEHDNRALYYKIILSYMINRKRLRSSIEMEPNKSGFLRWIETELVATNCDLTDHYCRFLINPAYEIRGNNIILELYCMPTQGTFQAIEFRPKLFINSTNLIQRPRIYNDRRVFHPNINVYTCQIVSKELVVDWNPTREFSALLHHLKYLIIQPNCLFVPNNNYNRKAAWHFHFNRANYRPLLTQYSPIHLENEASSQLGRLGTMEVEGTDGFTQSDYWGIDRVVNRNRKVFSVLDSFAENTEEEQNFQFLAKKINDLVFQIEENSASLEHSELTE